MNVYEPQKNISRVLLQLTLKSQLSVQKSKY